MKLFKRIFAVGLVLSLLIQASIVVVAEDEIEYIALRAELLERIGASVVWDGNSQTVLFKLRNGVEGQVKIGKDNWKVGNVTGKFDAPAIIIDGTTYVAEDDDFEKLVKMENASANILDTAHQSPANIFSVTADGETEAVSSGKDAADDPAIWIHPTDPSKSTLIATNKAGGILVYDLDGNELYSYKVGKVNNVDVRYNFNMQGQNVDIVGTSNRTDNSITMFIVNPATGELTEANGAPMISNMGEVYGFSFYHSHKNNKHYAWVSGKDGEVVQWELKSRNGKIEGEVVREFKLPSITEGIVADDEYGVVYIGEENEAIWKYNAEPNGGLLPIGRVDVTDGIRITEDVEGLTLYYGNDGRGYLIASSQGSDRYVIYDRQGNNEYITSFSIVDGDIDGSSETDGIDVMSFGLGDLYPNGIFITQDDENITDGIKYNQNFKIVSWDKIANGPHATLVVESQDPRQLINRQ